MRAHLLFFAPTAIVFLFCGSQLFRAGSRRLEAAEPPSARIDATAGDNGKDNIDQRAKQILAESSKILMAIESLEFRAEDEGTISLPTPKGPNVKLPPGWNGTVKNCYLFRSNGIMWRVDESVPSGPVTESYSFNGTMFQFLSDRLSAFRESKHRLVTRPQTPFPDPISSVFSWVYPTNGFRSREELRSRDNWDAVFKRARFIGEVQREGTAIATVEVERVAENGRKFLYSIEFDKDHGCTPVGYSSYSLPERKPSATVRVKRSLDADVGGNSHVRIPVEVETKWAGGDTVCRIVETSLRINQTIDDDSFTLPQSRAKHILGPYGLDEKTAEFFKIRGSLASRLSAAQDEARRNRQRVLLILGDPDAESSQRLFELHENELRRPLYEYQQLAIGKGDAAAMDSFKKGYPGCADLNWPALVVLDESGKALGALSLTLSGANRAAEEVKVREFLEQHAPEKQDAEKLLADALLRAKRESKAVFFQETGIYFAPCRLLSRYFEQHADVLQQSYVYLKIDPVRCTHGADVIKRIRSDGSVGIPWVAVLDANGKVLATHLGFASAESKGIDDFMQFLSKTSPRLTTEQLARLRSDLQQKP